MDAAFGLVMLAISGVLKRMDICPANQINVAASAAVSSVRPPLGLVLLALIGKTTVAAITGLDTYYRFVNKHGLLPNSAPGEFRMGSWCLKMKWSIYFRYRMAYCLPRYLISRLFYMIRTGNQSHKNRYLLR